MAAASNPTKKSSNDSRQKMIEKIADAREDIKSIYEESKKSFFIKLEMLAQKSDSISDKKPEADEADFKEIEDGVNQIKETAKSSVPRPQDSSAKTNDATDGKLNNIRIEREGWPQLDVKLEDILEKAAVKYMLEDYMNVNDGILKKCLLCLAIFPQDAIIQKRTLIYWWIGEGIVNATATETAEDVGESYFEKLLKGSWIYAVNNRSSPNVREFKMDPWVRWLVIYLARNEEFFNLDKTGMPRSFPSKCRYCLVKKTKEPTGLERKGSSLTEDGSTGSSHGERNKHQDGSTKGNKKGQPKFLSVFNVNAERLCAKDLFPKFREMKSLLVLHLGRWQTPAKCHLDNHECQTHVKCHHDCHIDRHIEFEDEESELLEWLHKLSLPKHLRYLSFAGISRITELPTSVKKLLHLKILDLRSCQNLEHLGKEIKFLKSLTHLDVSECYMLDHMPKGLATLSQLEVLKGFIIGSSRSKDPCRLAELAKLKKLRKLSISIGGEAQIQPKEMTKVKEINGLRSLAITWGKLSQTLPEDDKKTLKENWIELMSFPSGLEKLDLRCFPDKNVLLDPNLKKLTKLYIRGGQVENISIKAESDPKMDVEMIRLKFLKNLSQKWSELAECFPHLNYLEIHKCPKLEHFLELDKDNVWMKEPTSESPSTDTTTTTDVPANTPTNTSPSDSSAIPPPTGIVPTSNDGATTTSGPPDFPDRAPIPTDNSSPTTNITSSSPAPATPSGLAHTTSTSSVPNEGTNPTTNPGTSSSQIPPHPASPTTDAAHDTPTPTDPSNSLSSLDKGHVVADSSSITPTSFPVAQNNASISTTMSARDRDTSAAATDTTEVVGPLDISDRAPIPTDNSSTTTNNTSSSPAPAAPSGLNHSTTTPTSSSLATSAAVVPSANTSTTTPAIQSEDTTLTTTPNTSSSQTPPHPTSLTTDGAHATPTPTDATDPSYSLSSLDKGHVVADSSSITPTPPSLVAQNNASILATLSARDQDTSAASIDTVVTHPPGEPALATTHIDSLRTASSATQEAPDICPLPTMTDSTVSTTVSAASTVKDSSPASSSATVTGTAASPA